MTNVVILQRKVRIDRIVILKFVECLSDTVHESAGKTFSVVFVSDRRMKQLNKLFRGKDSTTDVLSFPLQPEPFEPDLNNLGDIVISSEQAQRQASENGLTLDNEIKQLILHGLLHLCGMDHEKDKGEMNARELSLRDKLGI